MALKNVADQRAGYAEKLGVKATLNSARRTGKTAPRVQIRKATRRQKRG